MTEKSKTSFPEHLGFRWDEESQEYVDKTEEEIEWPVYDEAKGG